MNILHHCFLKVITSVGKRYYYSFFIFNVFIYSCDTNKISKSSTQTFSDTLDVKNIRTDSKSNIADASREAIENEKNIKKSSKVLDNVNAGSITQDRIETEEELHEYYKRFMREALSNGPIMRYFPSGDSVLLDSTNYYDYTDYPLTPEDLALMDSFPPSPSDISSGSVVLPNGELLDSFLKRVDPVGYAREREVADSLSKVQKKN